MDRALVGIHALARQLGVPAPWLKREALAERIPSLKVGRRFFFNAAAVEEALLMRAASSERAKESGEAKADLMPEAENAKPGKGPDTDDGSRA